MNQSVARIHAVLQVVAATFFVALRAGRTAYDDLVERASSVLFQPPDDAVGGRYFDRATQSWPS